MLERRRSLYRLTKRIAIGGLYQESHSFSPAPATLEEFEACILVTGQAVFDQLSNANHEVSGALEALSDCDCVPLLYGATSASGMPLRTPCYKHLKDTYLGLLSDVLPVDGVVMTMHGATAAEDTDDVTGDLIAAVRDLIGPDRPITVSLDLHANVTARMAEHADALVGYHTAPHIDQKRTGYRAGKAMRHLLSGGSIHQAYRAIPALLPAENGQTTTGPFAEVMDQAVDLEESDDILTASVFSSQPWLDLSEVGSSVVVTTTGDRSLAEQKANGLAQALWDRRHAFEPNLVNYTEAIDRALANDHGPTILSDSGDAPSSGAPGDSTVLLSALLERDVQESAYLNIVDPSAVEQATRIGVGHTGTLTVGATYSDQFYAPVTFEGTIVTLFDGVFTFKGPAFNGVPFDMGKTAVIAAGGIRVMAMERGVLQWDPELYRCVGLVPRDAKLVAVKSPAAFRASYETFAHEIVNINAPGVCSPDLKSFPWARVPRPLYPLDNFDWSASEDA